MTEPEQQESAPVDAGTDTQDKTQGQWESLQQSRDQVRAKNAELKKLLAEHEVKENDRTAEAETLKVAADSKAGRIDKVIEHKDAQLDALKKQLAETTAQWEQAQQGVRRTGLVDAIAEQAPGANRFLLEAAVAKLSSADLDSAPESIDADFVTVWTDKLKQAAPALFAEPAQSPPPRNGSGPPAADQSVLEALLARANGENATAGGGRL